MGFCVIPLQPTCTYLHRLKLLTGQNAGSGEEARRGCADGSPADATFPGSSPLGTGPWEPQSRSCSHPSSALGSLVPRKALGCSASAWPHSITPGTKHVLPIPTCRIPRPQDKFEAARSGACLAALAPLPSVHPRAFSPSAQSPSESRILGDYLSLCSRLLLQNTIDCAAYKPHVYFSRFWRLKPQHRVPTCSGSGEGLLQAGGQRTSCLSSSGSSTKELSQPLS